MRTSPESTQQGIEQSTQQQFLRFALAQGVLAFGSFKTKAGRESPYFFNAGLFHHGAALASLADFYAQTLLSAQAQGRLQADRLFGPAYKGIALASSTAMALAARGHDMGFAFNRKEVKDHGEGGLLVGADLMGHRVVIIDDVISAGTSVGESVSILQAAGATVAGVLIALDRMEQGWHGSLTEPPLSSPGGLAATWLSGCGHRKSGGPAHPLGDNRCTGIGRAPREGRCLSGAVGGGRTDPTVIHSTVTLLARLRGLSTS